MRIEPNVEPPNDPWIRIIENVFSLSDQDVLSIAEHKGLWGKDWEDADGAPIKPDLTELREQIIDIFGAEQGLL